MSGWPVRLVGCLHRERDSHDRREWFEAGHGCPDGDQCPDAEHHRARRLPAEPEHDVCIPLREDASGRYVGLRCPDCDSDRIAWAEAGGVPGSRECVECGSRLTDSRYGVLIPDAPCVIRAAYRILIEDPASGDDVDGYGGSLAAAALARVHRPGWSPTEIRAAVALARERLARDPAMRRSLREALA